MSKFAWVAVLIVMAGYNAVAEEYFYADEMIVRFPREAIRDEYRGMAAVAAAEIAETERFLPLLQKTDEKRAQIISCRLEAASRLCRYIGAQLNDSGRDSAMFARQGMLELLTLLDYLKYERSRPALSVNALVSLNLADFGAVGDGVADDSAAFKNALARAAAIQKDQNKTIRIMIPPGNYKISGNKTPDYNFKSRDALQDGMPLLENGDPMWPTGHLVIANMNNIILEGQGLVRLLPTDSTLSAVTVVGCRNVTMRNIEIEYRDQTFTQGEVLTVNSVDNSIIWKKDGGFPSPILPRFLNAPQRLGSLHEKESGAFVWPVSTVFFENIVPIDADNYKITLRPHSGLKQPAREMGVGQKLTLTARYDAAKSVNLILSAYCEVDNVRVLSSPGVVFGTWNCTAATFRNCRIATAKDMPNLLTTGGDGFQASQNLIGPAVIDCDFSGMLDDGVMICTRQSKIIAVREGGKKILVPGLSARPGSRIAVMDPMSGQLKSEANCVAMRLGADWGDEKRGTELEFDVPLKVDVSMESSTGKVLSHKEMIPYYTGLKPFSKQPDALICLNHSNSGSVVANNRLHDYRGNGVAIRGAANVIVAGNYIDNIADTALPIGALMAWGESFPSHNILLRDNVITRVNTGCVIHFNTFAGQAPAYIVRGVDYINNSFDGLRKTGLYFSSCRDVTMEKNSFLSAMAGEGICIGRADHLLFCNNRFFFDKITKDKTFRLSAETGLITVDGVELKIK